MKIVRERINEIRKSLSSTGLKTVGIGATAMTIDSYLRKNYEKYNTMTIKKYKDTNQTYGTLSEQLKNLAFDVLDQPEFLKIYVETDLEKRTTMTTAIKMVIDGEDTQVSKNSVMVSDQSNKTYKTTTYHSKNLDAAVINIEAVDFSNVYILYVPINR